jgi:hypothetical protein
MCTACSRTDYEEVQKQLAQVLRSCGAAQQAAAVARGEVAPETYYKVCLWCVCGRGGGLSVGGEQPGLCGSGWNW